MAFVQHNKKKDNGWDVLCEALTNGEHMFGTHSPVHMHKLAAIWQAVRETAYDIADRVLQCEQEAPLARQLPAVSLPSLLQRMYPQCTAFNLCGDPHHLVYMLHRPARSAAGQASTSSQSAKVPNVEVGAFGSTDQTTVRVQSSEPVLNSKEAFQVPAEGLVVKFWQKDSGADSCPVEVQHAWFLAGVAPRVLGTHRVGGEWWGTVMECLHPNQGWRTVHYLLSKAKKGDSEVPRPTGAELNELRKAAVQALARGHAWTLPDQCTKERRGTVHGDMHLCNVMARRTTGTAWEVNFVDFGWSGVDRRSRYPVLVNLALPWAQEVKPRGHLRQAQDTKLLDDSLDAAILALEENEPVSMQVG